ncbi:MAG: NAD(+)/NADH kinase [Nitrospirae bacterium]|nr:NAD(+)/NADH kinase [Nitrospirota bacterium]
MKRVGIIAKRGVPEALEAVRDVLQWLKERKYAVTIDEKTASSLGIKGSPAEKVPSKSDIILVFGGDGTLLSAARMVGDMGIPILGINLGTLGFITEISRNEMLMNLDKVFSGKYKLEERIRLSADVYRSGKKAAGYSALNDVVLNKSALSRMFQLDIHINKKYVTTFKADGLIVSTPTGSTAHSLSAGGPVLYPTVESFVMTPICPHTLTSRPLVLPDDFILEAVIKSGDNVYMTLDGQVGSPLRANDRIMIKKARFTTNLVHLYDRDYFYILRSKMKWGE